LHGGELRHEKPSWSTKSSKLNGTGASNLISGNSLHSSSEGTTASSLRTASFPSTEFFSNEKDPLNLFLVFIGVRKVLLLNTADPSVNASTSNPQRPILLCSTFVIDPLKDATAAPLKFVILQNRIDTFEKSEMEKQCVNPLLNDKFSKTGVEQSLATAANVAVASVTQWWM
jgi:hypothetical protein